MLRARKIQNEKPERVERCFWKINNDCVIMFCDENEGRKEKKHYIIYEIKNDEKKTFKN